MQAVDHSVLPHHEAAARLWSLGGAGYERVSFAISDALAHATQRLSPKPDEDVLDVATGTGWVARNLSMYGANVTAVDISEGLLEAAKTFSTHIQPPISYRLADAENLPFDDKAFDRVVSTFGVMFAQNHRQAAKELARVCKPSGRLVLTTWVPDGSVAEFFGIIGKHNDAPKPPESPLEWGKPQHIVDLLGDEFDFTFEEGVSNSYYDTVDDLWNGMAEGFGPVRNLVNTLEADMLDDFRREIDDYHAAYTTDDGLIHIRREYLVAIGRRR